MNELQEDLQLLQAGLPVLHPIHDTPQAEQQLPNRYIACTKSASIPNPGQIPGQADSGSSTEPVPAIKCTEFLQQDRSQHGTASDQKLRSFVIYPQAMQLAPHQHAYAADNLGFASHSPDETPRFTEGSCFDLGPGLLLQPCIRRGLHWMATVAMPAVAQRLPSVQLKLWTAAAKGGHPGSQWWLWRLPGGGLCSIYRAAPLLDADLPWLVRMLYVLGEWQDVSAMHVPALLPGLQADEVTGSNCVCTSWDVFLERQCCSQHVTAATSCQPNWNNLLTVAVT